MQREACRGRRHLRPRDAYFLNHLLRRQSLGLERLDERRQLEDGIDLLSGSNADLHRVPFCREPRVFLYRSHSPYNPNHPDSPLERPWAPRIP
jgi:hypothetical protein